MNAMSMSDSEAKSTNADIESPLSDRIAVIVLGALFIGAVILFIGFWWGAITRSPVFGEMPELPWLHAHVLVYLLGNALLIGTLTLSIYYRVTGTSTRFPWLELGVLGVSIFFLAGLFTGSRFALPAWGHNPLLSDGKLIIATVTATFTTVIVLPISILMRLLVSKNRRHLVLACLLLLVAILSVYSFFFPVLSLHPEGMLIP